MARYVMPDGVGGRPNHWVDAITIGKPMTRGKIVTGSVKKGFHVTCTSIRLPCEELEVLLPEKL